MEAGKTEKCFLKAHCHLAHNGILAKTLHVHSGDPLRL